MQTAKYYKTGLFNVPRPWLFSAYPSRSKLWAGSADKLALVLKPMAFTNLSPLTTFVLVGEICIHLQIKIYIINLVQCKNKNKHISAVVMNNIFKISLLYLLYLKTYLISCMINTDAKLQE